MRSIVSDSGKTGAVAWPLYFFLNQIVELEGAINVFGSSRLFIRPRSRPVHETSSQYQLRCCFR